MAPKRPRIAPRCVARSWFDSHGIEPASSDNGVGAIKGSFWVLFLRFSQKSGFRKRMALQGLERLSFRRLIFPPPPSCKAVCGNRKRPSSLGLRSATCKGCRQSPFGALALSARSIAHALRAWCPMLYMVGRGYAVASVEYRFSQMAVFPSQIQDCQAAIRWLFQLCLVHRSKVVRWQFTRLE